MAQVERKHEILSEPLDDDLLRSRGRQGWRPVGVVWERTVDDAPAARDTTAIPYGLRVSADCQSLEPAADEIGALVHMLHMVVAERAFSEIADSLNEHGYRTRSGEPWNQTTVFHLLPRMIEVAPAIYSSEQWSALRQHRRP